MHLISPNDRVGRKIDHSQNKSFYCRICGAGFDKSGEWKKHVLDVHQSKGECHNGDHPFFLEYQKKVVTHPNFKGMPESQSKTGKVSWMATGKSKLGQKRVKWWIKQRKKLGIIVGKNGKYKPTADALSLGGKHVCNICGCSAQVRYVYPTLAVLEKINAIHSLKAKFPFLYYDENNDSDIGFIINKLYDDLGKEHAFKETKKIFKLENIKNDKEIIIKYILEEKKSMLSPGVMSNAPDRLDGYHSYNACCRPCDSGRSKKNLATYSQDRRVYEKWSGGNWKAADRLMARFRNDKNKKSADHIGPISQGFCHRPVFWSTTLKENIIRRDNLRIKDILRLMEDEGKGAEVVSKFASNVWDELKKLPKTDEDAKKVGIIMHQNVDNVLKFFFEITKVEVGKVKVGKNFLTENFLSPEYAYADYKFEGFDSNTGNYKKMKTIPGTHGNYANEAKRYVRKSFEVLKQYEDKQNRRIRAKLWKGNDIDEYKKAVIGSLKSGDLDNAKVSLFKLFKIFSKYAKKDYGIS